MKKIIAFILLFVAVNVSAQNDTDTVTGPVVTAVGKPAGAKTEIKVSKDGGSLKSSDGMVGLIIPGGAVPKNTNISIEPITNLMTNGNGKAYRLEPSGIQFKKPLQLIFNYDGEEIKDSMQLLMGIAMQDDKGQWLGLKNFTLDTVAKTISGNISHFSDWSYFSELKIEPATARVKVKNSIYLSIAGVKPTPKQTSGDDEVVPLEKQPKKVIWSVNEIVGGDAAVGKLARGSGESLTAGNIYFAPSTLPDKNPVAVSVNLQGLTYTTEVKGKAITFNKLKLVSNILIYDNAYEVTIVHSMDVPGAGTRLGTVHYLDTGSLVISVNGKDSKIIEKVNKNTTANWGYKDGDCIQTMLKPGPGTVHIIGAKSIIVTPPAAPGSNAWVSIEFISVPTILPLLHFKCPHIGGQKGWYTGTTATTNTMVAKMMQAFPQRIRFEAKEGEQTILDIDAPEAKVKITVKQLKED